jgi:hypothetical protein
MLNKLAKILRKAKERANRPYIGWCRPSFDDSCFICVYLYALLANNVTQEFYFRAFELTFRWLDFKVIVPQDL